jgi:hypothetical protein
MNEPKMKVERKNKQKRSKKKEKDPSIMFAIKKNGTPKVKERKKNE